MASHHWLHQGLALPLRSQQGPIPDATQKLQVSLHLVQAATNEPQETGLLSLRLDLPLLGAHMWWQRPQLATIRALVFIIG